MVKHTLVLGAVLLLAMHAGAQANPPSGTTPQQPSSTAPSAQPQQSADGSYVLRRSARLVVLDVVVTDRKGNVITGLPKSAFHVTELDQPQTLLNFEEAGVHAVPQTASIHSTAELDSVAPQAPVNILLLDEFNTRFEDMAFARYSLKKILQKQPDKLTTPTMLIAVSLTNFTVLQDYTQDKQALIKALDHHFVAFPWQVHNGGWIGERFATAFGTMTRVAQAVTGHAGHKNMIWIGRGFPAYNFINGPVDTENRVNNAVQQCVNELRDARITLYTIDPAGLTSTPGGGYGDDAAFNDPFGGNYQFSKLAAATGGRSFYGRNDVDTEIGDGIRDGASFYSVAYRPTTNATDPKKFRRIKVTLDDPNLKATTREGYYVELPPARVNPENPSRRLAFEVLSADSSNMVYDGVPLRISPDPQNPDAFNINVDGKGLVWSNATDTTPRMAEVVVLASTFDKKNKELKRISKIVRVPAKDVPPVGQIHHNLDLHFVLDHDPKAVRARFVVRVSATGRIGTADAKMNQPVQAQTQTPVKAAP